MEDERSHAMSSRNFPDPLDVVDGLDVEKEFSFDSVLVVEEDAEKALAAAWLGTIEDSDDDSSKTNELDLGSAVVPYACAGCDTYFRSHGDLVRHEMTHKELVIQCPVCRKIIHHCQFDRHLRVHKKPRPNQCINCGEAYVYFEKHQGSCKGGLNQVLECPECRDVVTGSLITDHLKDHALAQVGSWGKNESGFLQCYQCEREFGEIYAAMNHMLRHYLPDRKFECELCCYPSLTEELTDWHRKNVCLRERFEFQRKHETSEPSSKKFRKVGAARRKRPCERSRVKCNLCNKELNKASLANHKNIVHKEHVEAYECPVCEKIYYSKPTLSFHIQTAHSIEAPVFPCGTCRKLFSTAAERAEHAKALHKPQKITCVVCGKELVYYSAKCHYLRHAWEALGIPDATSETLGNFPCNRCERTFHFAQHFVNHLVNHFQIQRIFECDKCYLALTTQTLLAKHRIACNGFAAESDLRKNPIRQLPVKKTSPRTDKVLEKDKDDVTPDDDETIQKWQCEKCRKLYNTEEQCNEHIRAEHSEDGEESEEATEEPVIVIMASE